MRNAVVQKDLQQLKELNSIGWAIAAIILGGLVPGVMMIVAYSQINDLPETVTYAHTTPSFTPGAMDKIMQLKKLVDSGAITQQDFEEQKQHLLLGSAPKNEPPEMEELRKLKALLDCSAITDEEYKTQKRKILNSLNLSVSDTTIEICPSCQAINQEGARFCENCGASLST
jgi:hypothetical protein